MQNTPSYDESNPALQALKKLVEDPRVQRVLAEIGALPKDEQLQAIFTRLAPQALVAEGLEGPEGYRVTTSVSWHPADPTLRTSNAAETGQNMAGRSVSRIEANMCIPILGGLLCVPVTPTPPTPPDPSDLG